MFSVQCCGEKKMKYNIQLLNLHKFFKLMNNINTDIIEKAWDDRSMLNDPSVQAEIYKTVELLDKGRIRVAEPADDGWLVNQWIKKAVILYFPIRKMEVSEAGPLEFHDKIPLKKDYMSLGVRVVPHAVARYGSYIARGVIMMPSFVNIGAYVGEGTMVDT